MSSPQNTVTNIDRSAVKPISLFVNTRYNEGGSDEWGLYHLLLRLPDNTKLYLTSGQTFTPMLRQTLPPDQLPISAKEVDVATLKSKIAEALTKLPDDVDIGTRIKTASNAMQRHYNSIQDFVNVNPNALTPKRKRGEPEPWPKVANAPEFVLNYCVSQGAERNQQALQRALPHSLLAMGADADLIGDKNYFPTLRGMLGANGEVLCASEPVKSREDILRLLSTMATNENGIILKKPFSMQGDGIYRIYRNAEGVLLAESAAAGEVKSGEAPLMHRTPLDDVLNQPEVKELFAGDGMLAMPCLDTSKGDVRVIAVDGEVVGAFNRVPNETVVRHTNVNEDSGWRLGNIAKGATAQPYAMSDDEKLRLAPLLKHLNDERGMHFVSLDMLADETGKRFVTEINGSIPLFDKISKLEVPNGKDQPDGMAERIAERLAALVQSNHARIMQRSEGIT